MTKSQMSQKPILLTIAIYFLGSCKSTPMIQEPVEQHIMDLNAILKFAQLSKISYETETKINDFCEQEKMTCYTKLIESTNNRFVLFSEKGSNVERIPIRGTSNRENAILDAEFLKEDDSTAKIKLHSGFAKSVNAMFPFLKTRLRKDRFYEITGHSLGGAEAVILAMFMHQFGYHVKNVITFGQPMVTDKSGAKRYIHLPLTRVVDKNDLVPYCPPTELIYLLNPYVHFGTEIDITDESEKISSKERSLNFWSHLSKEFIWNEIKDHLIASYISSLKNLTNSDKS